MGADWSIICTKCAEYRLTVVKSAINLCLIIVNGSFRVMDLRYSLYLCLLLLNSVVWYKHSFSPVGWQQLVAHCRSHYSEIADVEICFLLYWCDGVCAWLCVWCRHTNMISHYWDSLLPKHWMTPTWIKDLGISVQLWLI